MIFIHMAAALLAISLGVIFCIRSKQPLFFKILLFGCSSYFLGALFEGCWVFVYQSEPTGFHVGYLGYMGMWFFLFSSYFGAIDRLADGGERAYLPYRTAALAGPALVLGLTGWSLARWGLAESFPLALLAVPLGLTFYFALKHLLLPDVELGIIRVMRPYNLCVILLCLCQTLLLFPRIPAGAHLVIGTLLSVLLAVLLPAAEMGVRKWFI